ncbi:fibrinogen-like protein A [Mytilus trossulus]|uniref:fibrinogen-like protein A n=1 Tax=Mytilus trossulus TaxID=6551 RepID=UPI00300542EB
MRKSYCSIEKQLNSICKTSEECMDTIFCNHGICKCDRIDYWAGRNCSTRKNIHASCTKTDECTDFLYCINRSCSCFDPLNDFWNGTVCIPKKKQGQTCFSSEECIGLLDCLSTDNQSVNKTICRRALECADISFLRNDAYTIYPEDEHPKLAYCVIEGGVKWTVIQRRINGSVDFDRTWQEYKDGFGNVNGELWLGNEAIHMISSNGRHKLRVDLEVSNGGKSYAEYSTFLLNDEQSEYLLNVTGYSGTAGDSMDAVGYEGRVNGSPFTTKDRKNEIYSCNQMHHGGWWYVNCDYSDLNREYGLNGYPSYMDWHYNLGTNVVKSRMMISKY